MKIKTVWAVMVVLLLVTMLSFPGAVPAQAATGAQIETSVQKGLTWLVSQQNADGSWGTSYQVGYTGLAVVKLCDRAFELKFTSPFDPLYPYSQNVIKGLDYIFSTAAAFPGTPEYPCPGTIHFVPWSGEMLYETGVAMMAIAATRAPLRVVGEPNPVVNGMTYKQVLQATVNFIVCVQNSDGGWRYRPTPQCSDNSVTGYVVLGLRYAEAALYGFNCIIPPATKTNLSNFITAFQYLNPGDPDDGASWYTCGWSWFNLLKTGNLLFEMTFVGDTTATPRVQSALGYIQRHWMDAGVDPGFRGLPPGEQAAFCLMKGLDSLGITTLNVGGNPNFDWFDDMSTLIVNAQQADGHWNAVSWGDNLMETIWALLTLEKVAPPSPTQSDLCPNKYRWSPGPGHAPGYKWDPYPTTFKSWNQVRFINNGPGDAKNVIATIVCAPVNVAIVDGIVSFGNIPAGGSAWSIDDYALVTDMTNPQNPNKGIVWRVEYDDPAGYHHVINNVPKFCGETIHCP